MPIRVTRRLLAAALDGSLHRADFRTDPHFGLAVPAQVPGVEPHILDPIRTWRNKGEFAEVAGRLVQMFRDNFKQVRRRTPTSAFARPARRRASRWRDLQDRALSISGSRLWPSPGYFAASDASRSRAPLAPAASARA